MTANVSDDLKASALAYHRLPRPGKVAIQSTKPLAQPAPSAIASAARVVLAIYSALLALNAVASVPSSSQSSSPPTGTPCARRVIGMSRSARRSAR